MTSAFDLRSIAGWFRLVALLEAVSWVGLLVGMYFKYLGTPRTEIGVKVFGMAHGLIFLGFVVVGRAGRDRIQMGGRSMVAGVAREHRAACSVIFLIWADRTGRMGLQPRHGGRGATGAVCARNDMTDLWGDSSTTSHRRVHGRCG